MLYKENGVIKGKTQCPYCDTENLFIGNETGTAIFTGAKQSAPILNTDGQYVPGDEISLDLLCKCRSCGFSYKERDYLYAEQPKR